MYVFVSIGCHSLTNKDYINTNERRPNYWTRAQASRHILAVRRNSTVPSPWMLLKP